MKLNLGCGNDPRVEYANVDRRDLGHNFVWDLNHFPWPWENNEIEEILMLDVLEHLDDVIRVLEECWRILKPGGTLQIRVPNGASENALTDPTHKHFFTIRSMEYFVTGTELEQKYSFYSQIRFEHAMGWVDEDNNINWTLRKSP